MKCAGPVALAVALLTASRAGGELPDQETRAPARVRRVGILGYGVAPQVLEAFRTGMRSLGYVEGRDVAYEYRCSEGRVEDLPSRLADLERLKVDVIVANGTPSVRAAKDARILKCAAPAELPVEQPLAFDLVINGRTAKVLGIRIPPELLLQADKLFE